MDRRTAANKVLPKAGVNGFDWTFVQGSIFVLRLNFLLKLPAFGNTQNVSGHCNGRQCKHETTIKKKMILLKNRNQRFVKLKEVQSSSQADTIAPHLILPNAPKTHRHGNN